MALSKIQSESVNLADNFAFTGTVSGAGGVTASTNSATEGGAATTNVVQGLAKAWASVDADATDHPTLDALNISTTADINTGVTKIAFTNAFSNAFYGICGAGQAQSESGGVFGVWGRSTTSSRQMTTTDYHTDCRVASSSGARDLVYFGMSVHGDLA